MSDKDSLIKGRTGFVVSLELDQCLGYGIAIERG